MSPRRRQLDHDDTPWLGGARRDVVGDDEPVPVEAGANRGLRVEADCSCAEEADHRGREVVDRRLAAVEVEDPDGLARDKRGAPPGEIVEERARWSGPRPTRAAATGVPGDQPSALEGDAELAAEQDRRRWRVEVPGLGDRAHLRDRNAVEPAAGAVHDIEPATA